MCTYLVRRHCRVQVGHCRSLVMGKHVATLARCAYKSSSLAGHNAASSCAILRYVDRLEFVIITGLTHKLY